MRRNVVTTCTLLMVLWGTACSDKPKRIRPPSIDAELAGAGAVELYDTDGNGALSRSELAACPGILAAFDQYDANGDSQVQPEEVTARIKNWQESRIGIIPFTCWVQLDGRPLGGATVKLIPEPFLGEAIQVASGTSEANGQVVLAILSDQLPAAQQRIRGVQLGLYKVEVTHPRGLLPEKYNVHTELGCEVTPESVLKSPRFELSLR